MAQQRLRRFPATFLELEASDETETRRLAGDIAMILRPGDVVCLSGDLGAGKSTFARALIRSCADDTELEVPSPTFTLVQVYELPRFDLSHFDLYRLEEPEELEELGLHDLLETGAALIEWPELAEDLLPAKALWIQITETVDDGEERQFAFFSNDPAWEQRIRQTIEVRNFLKAADLATAERRFLAGDASLRTFETVTDETGKSILMRWPFSQDAVSNAVRDYMSRVHLAQDCRSVLAIGSELRRQGIRAPQVFASDLEKGLVLSEDLGGETIVVDGRPDPERYGVAVDILVRMHGRNWPRTVQFADGGSYTVPNYSNEALIAEAALFLDWYVPEFSKITVDAELRREFETLWQQYLDEIAGAQQGWVLRDFHSPNLLWQHGAAGTDRIGLIDLQDTVIGPVAYDVASLLLDARTEMSPELETGLYDAYVSGMEKQSSGFDRESFSRAYSVMAAQRVSKILGIFVRLARRDNKPAYLGHLPRMQAYFDRVLDRPGMSDLKDWYGRFRK
ncbi:tRNA (adenosine(37)-N6)-threonylcarbamoyltransferase complex ATPase subunit type 1 TsaE [uncultured Roseibium sp.]|uniref:tRNA (adenosine(37)-N6)-threonylcarbamoyltransferase complex ATPase subunit type 1 TsaE n=1 Tax=uncultured Roseibium sp. TaxID=1936171 RepID=UPI00261E85CB|nr:tRNA (adenosine(37)-N6)-threonylcarbamoyltransferase complex ATPase subunit type 1 TsaE [uncultured Roseibium sp.]